MNELCEWQKFLTDNPNDNPFDRFIDLLKQLDNNTSPDLWVKWKNYSHQVVIETPSYYYKIYQEDPKSGQFIIKVRNELAKIYSEQYGIHWRIITQESNGYIYQIEQREKLQLCSEEIMTFDELFLNWYKTLEILEKALFLDKLHEQLVYKLPELARLKLIRDCSNKFADYAIKDNHVILLDDADWFIGMVDKNGQWLSPMYNVYPIITLDGEQYLAPLNVFEMNMIEIRSTVDKWMILTDMEKGLEKKYRDFYNARNKMLSENIQVLTTGKALPNNKTLFVEKPNLDALENTHLYLQISHQ